MIHSGDEPQGIRDSWMRALAIKANDIKLGGEIPAGCYILRDSMRYQVLYRVGAETAQVIALCDGTRDLVALTRDTSRILGKDEKAVQKLVEKTAKFLADHGLLDSPARRARKMFFWMNPFRMFRALWYVAAYHFLGRRG